MTCRDCYGSRRKTLTKMARELVDRLDDYILDPEPQYEPELENLTRDQIRLIRINLDTIIRGVYPDNPVEGT